MLLIVVLVAAIALAVHPAPTLIADWTIGEEKITGEAYVAYVTAVRRDLLQGTGALLLIVAATTGLRQLDLARAQAERARRARLADAFSNAAAQLAEPKPVAQLAGIYSLEQLMDQNPDMKTSAAALLQQYIRIRPRPGGADFAIVEAMRIYCCHSLPSQKELTNCSLGGLDLTGVDLKGARLSGSDLHGAIVSGPSLEGADLRGTNVDRATVIGRLAECLR